MVNSSQNLFTLRQTLILGLMFLIWLPSTAWSQKQLTLEIDRTYVEQGDIIQMALISNFQTQSSGPDFSVLEQDFDLLGVSASNQLRVINGQFSATTIWDVQLIARQAGSFTIPAFEVENAQSQPVQIKVTPASEPKEDFAISFLEAQVNRMNPYIQSEVIYTLRYYHLGSLIRGSIDPPRFPNALSERLRNQHSFERRVNGRTYRVYEWVYSIFPQTSGKWTIPAQTFEGRLLNQGQVRLVSEQTEALTLNVRPIPDEYPQDALWLPARNLKLTEEWTDLTEPLQVGDTVARQLSVQAYGLKASQLPNLYWRSDGGYRLYSDPVVQNEHQQNLRISSIKSQDFMAMMQTEGQFSVPEISIPWWNTETDQLEVAVLPAREWVIEANPDLISSVNPDLDNLPQELQPSESNSAASWMITLLTLALLMISLSHLHTYRQLQKLRQLHAQAMPTLSTETSTKLSTTLSAQAQADLNVLFKQEGAALYEGIKRWLKQQYQIKNWQQLAQTNPDTYRLLQQFQQQLYQGKNNAKQPDLKALKQALTTLKLDVKEREEQSQLKPIYPH